MTAFRLGCALLLLFGAASCGDDDPASPPPDTDGPAAQRVFRPNRLGLTIGNDGARHDPNQDALTFDDKPLIYDLGLWIGARVDGEDRVSATSYFGSEFEPMPLGAAGDSVALVYVLRPGDGPGDPDYDAWPVRAGAPADQAGRPGVLGAATAWTAHDDRDAARHTRFGSAPLGATVRFTAWGQAHADSVLFVHLQVRNEGDRTWDDTLLGIWVDADLGNAQNDLVGTQVDEAIGYTYTAPGVPEDRFGVHQPALGIRLLKTPHDIGYYAFPRIWKAENEPGAAAEAFALLRGRNRDGSAYHDSTTGEPTRYTASGDPLQGTGSIEHVPADRRMLLVTGPVTVAPGDSLSLVYGIFFARDPDPYRALAKMRNMAATIAQEPGLWDLF